MEVDGGLAEVDQLDYTELDPSEQGPVRYFRVLQGDGSQFPFSAGGDTLTSAGYSRLGRAERGSVVAEGDLMRVTFAAPVYRNGTTLVLAARNSGGGTDPEAPWQTIEAGDATPAFDGNTLSIGVPLGLAALSEVEISPNPFTPNGDGINDAARIGFSVFKITAGRELGVSIHSLDGRRVWEAKQVVFRGSAHDSMARSGQCRAVCAPGNVHLPNRARCRFQGAGRGRGGPTHFGCLLRDLNIWEGVVRKIGRPAATILVAVALAGTISSAAAQEYGSRLGNVRRGGEVSFDPRGPGFCSERSTRR